MTTAVVYMGSVIVTGHPLKIRALTGRMDAAIDFRLGTIGDTDSRAVAELRVRRWPGYMNRHYRKRSRLERAIILSEMAVRW